MALIDVFLTLLRIGLVEHPGWYQGLDRRTANRRAIQDRGLILALGVAK